jgi:hypothetical protein
MTSILGDFYGHFLCVSFSISGELEKYEVIGGDDFGDYGTACMKYSELLRRMTNSKYHPVYNQM